jgi:asparagine synthase (glutamine-hydrolysing)
VYRYVALIWDTANAATTTAIGHISQHFVAWTRVVDEPGLVLFHVDVGSSETRVLESGAGAICGRLFADAGARSDFVATGGRDLIDHHWGRYVAFLRNAATGEVHVVRDPTGGLPCFATRLDDVHIVFSDLESILAVEGLKFSINWQYVAAFVPYSALQIRATGLNEVTEVQAGERISFRAGTSERELLWDPMRIVARGFIENPAEAGAAIRECVQHCVQTWAGLHRSVIHNLSGGLDSSLVLSCLASMRNRPEVTCLHFYAPSSREDERKFARLAAAHFGAELVECALEPDALDLQQLLYIRRSPRPWFYIYDLEQGSIESRVAAQHRATTIFSGSGGDGLFLQARAELAVADYLRRHGFTPQVIRVALNAARITRSSLWPILRNGIRAHLRRPLRHQFGGMEEIRTLIPTDVFAAARNDDSLIHPWLVNVGSIPPGMRWQIMCVSIAPAFYNSFDNPLEVERTPALFSQPLIELCLRIPSYTWISGGRDRSLVRQAFAADLQPAIVRRTQKGAIDRHNRKLMDANERFIREMLLDGVLVSRGLLDRERLETFLSRAASPIGYEYNEVLRQHLCTEMWVRRWPVTSSSAR